MGGIFQTIKERIRKNALIKSGLLGGTVGLTTAAALLFVSAFVPTVSPLLSILGLATGALTFTLVYLLCNKNDKRLAKSLDTKLGLHERVQTMVEFKEADGDMFLLQREDAAEKLSAVPAEKFKIRNLWRYFVALALAVVLTIGSVVTVVIRGNADEGTKTEQAEDPPYKMDDWQQAALEELIREVKASALQAYVKDPLVVELETLLAALPDIKMQSVMKANVKTTIKNVDTIVEGVNSYKPIYYALIESEHPVTLAFADLFSDLDASTFGRGLDEIKNAKNDEDVFYFVEATDKALLKANLGDFGASISAGLETLTAVEEDQLYPAITAFATELSRLSSLSDNYGLGSITEGVDKAFSTATEEIGNAIYEQEVNEEWKVKIIRRLQEIFGLSDSELPKLSEGIVKGDGGNDPDEPPDDNGNGGGAGDGEILAGSNSLVYDPDTNTQVHYLDILDEYYAIVVAQMNDGTISKELAACLIKYYQSLYDGAAQEEQK